MLRILLVLAALAVEFLAIKNTPPQACQVKGLLAVVSLAELLMDTKVAEVAALVRPVVQRFPMQETLEAQPVRVAQALAPQLQGKEFCMQVVGVVALIMVRGLLV
jgi:hypothetical protein